jgi:hypothetical protein
MAIFPRMARSTSVANSEFGLRRAQPTGIRNSVSCGGKAQVRPEGIATYYRLSPVSLRVAATPREPVLLFLCFLWLSALVAPFVALFRD